jgi:hypothetical protein
MRKYEISPAIVAAMRNRAMAAQFREVGVPLYLELPQYHELTAPPGYAEVEAEDARVSSDFGATDKDDDFY